jgi:hypothetical protein
MRSIIILCSIVAGSLSAVVQPDHCSYNVDEVARRHGIMDYVKQYVSVRKNLLRHGINRESMDTFKHNFCLFVWEGKADALITLLAQMTALDHPITLSTPTMDDLPARVRELCPGKSLESLPLSTADREQILKYVSLRIEAFGKLPDAFMRQSKHLFCNLLGKSFFSFFTEFKLNSTELSKLHDGMKKELEEFETLFHAH